MKKTYTIEDLKKFAESKNGKCLSNDYINAHTKYLWQDEHGNQWEAKWYSILNGRWSPFTAQERKAAKLQKYSIEYCQQVAESKGGKCLSTEYFRTGTKLLWSDSKGREFKMTLWNVMAGQWSPFEKAEKLSILKTKYTITDLKNFAKKYNWECLSTEYTAIHDSYQWKAPWGRIYKRKWADVLRRGLTARPHESAQETELATYIESLGIAVERNRRDLIKPFEIDIFCPELNTAIEFNGVRWHGKEKNYHLNKTKMCEALGIELIQIFDSEWNERKTQIKSFLKAKLGKNKHRIYARKCEVALIDKKEANDFLEKTHILGKVNHLQAFGLKYNGELVSVITIGLHHRNARDLVLSRYAGKTDYSVIGGLSRLTKAATTFFDNQKIITWVDRRISNGLNWEKSGWTKVETLKPDYFYYDPATKTTIPKQRRKKSVVKTPEGMTESQHADLDGLIRVYDCGKIRLETHK